MYRDITHKCTTIKTLVKQTKLTKAKQSKERTYTKPVVNILAETMMKKSFKRKKKKHTEEL